MGAGAEDAGCVLLGMFGLHVRYADVTQIAFEMG